MFRRTALLWTFLGLILVVAAAAPTVVSDSQDLAALAKARLDAVEKIYQLQAEMRKRGEGPMFDLEQDYTWSRRWLDAQRDVSGKKTAPVTALETHLARMKQLQSLVQQGHKAGASSYMDLLTAEFYRLEAEF